MDSKGNQGSQSLQARAVTDRVLLPKRTMRELRWTVGYPWWCAV